MLKQLSNSGSDFDHYGITNIRYQRKGPVSLVVSLDSPEAVAFIRDGSGGLTPEEKKKRLEDMLAASDEYIDTAFPENKIISDRIKVLKNTNANVPKIKPNRDWFLKFL